MRGMIDSRLPSKTRWCRMSGPARVSSVVLMFRAVREEKVRHVEVSVDDGKGEGPASTCAALPGANRAVQSAGEVVRRI